MYRPFRFSCPGCAGIMADSIRSSQRTDVHACPLWRWITRGVGLGMVSLGLVLGESGCTRQFFRRRADEQVDAVIAEKDKYPQWQLDQFHVYPDPRARFADWTNPDRPP